MRRLIAFAVAAGLGVLVAGCGLGPTAGWVIHLSSIAHSKALPGVPPSGSVTVTQGPGTAVAFGRQVLQISSGDFAYLSSVSWKLAWVPVVQVPTLRGMRDTVIGTVSLQLPAAWTAPGQPSWDGGGPTLNISIDKSIPARSERGAILTLYLPIRVAVIQGGSASAAHQRLTVAVGTDVGRARWGSLRANVLEPLSGISAMRYGQYFGFSTGNGGTNRYGQQIRNWSYEGLHVHLTTTSHIAFLAGENVVVYDRGTNWGRLYMQPLLPGQQFP